MKKKLDVEILFENERYVVINKPAGIATLADRASPDNLYEQMGQRFSDIIVKPVHRLDKETSGVLVFSKGEEPYRNLAMQFEARTVTKMYHALVEGAHDWRDKMVNKPIRKTERGSAFLSIEGKEAETHFTTLKKWRRYSLIACTPITGRMHQIRLHLQSLGVPIISDIYYGGKFLYLSAIKRKFKKKEEYEESPLINRVALHARSISFADEGKIISVEAPYPKDFNVAMKRLDEFDS